MDKKRSKGKSGGSKLMQAFLKVSGDDSPTLVFRPKESGSYPANLVLLNGVVIDAEDETSFNEEDSWVACAKVAEMCRLGNEYGVSARNALCEHLAYAYSILCDYLGETEGDWLMSKETSETLIRGAIDRIVRAGKCFGFSLDKYRSDE